jgi:hypothetical protein
MARQRERVRNALGPDVSNNVDSTVSSCDPPIQDTFAFWGAHRSSLPSGPADCTRALVSLAYNDTTSEFISYDVEEHLN